MGTKYWNYEDEGLHYTPRMEIVPKRTNSLKYSHNAIHPRLADLGPSNQRTVNERNLMNSSRGIREKDGVIEITAGEPGDFHQGGNL